MSHHPTDHNSATTAPDTEFLSDDNAEIVAEFLVESRGNLADAEAALLALEAMPKDADAIARVFRAFHTIKGVATLLSLGVVSGFAHAAENLLSRVRSGEIDCVGRNATLALQSVDVLRACMDNVEAAVAERSPMRIPDSLEALREALEHPEMRGPPLVQESASRESGVQPSAARVVEPGTNVPEAPLASSATPGTAPTADPEAGWIRVRTERLDRLLDMVGELVIAQSMVSQDPMLWGGEWESFRKKVAQETKIVRELQEHSMALRMVPLRPAFQKLTRLVRDVVQRTKKQVSFATEGEDTEIDRHMVNVIADPLVHMVRNAIDHGIEDVEKRRTAGKPAAGQVRLRASHEGGNIVLRLSDDGGGIDRKVVAAKAVERKLIASDQGMSDAEVYALIFEPGFSTRDTVTDMSGRGVGMDVVKRGVEELKGRIEIASELGKGTTFTLRIPLTLAITDGMLLRIGAERFLLPLAAIRTSFRPTREMLSTVAGRGEFVQVRDEFLALYRLHHLFQVPQAERDPTRAILVVVEHGESRCAFLVDELLGQQQVVSKGLLREYLNVRGVSGGAILGDGRVGLILDPQGLMTLGAESGAWGSAA